MKMKFNSICAFFGLVILLLIGCSKEEDAFEDPYSDGKEPLGIKTSPQTLAEPASGTAGTLVAISATGLLPYKEEVKVLFNGEEGEIITVDSTGIKAKVPSTASTGVISLVVGDQVFFGPKFRVEGKVKIDPTFEAMAGTDNFISGGMPLENGYFLVGAFTNYDEKGFVRPINRIVRILPDGSLDRTLNSGDGANGVLNSIIPLQSNYMIAGNFNGYDKQRQNIRNITKLKADGSIDEVFVNTFTENIINVPSFNGGTDGMINNIYNQDNKIIASGNFKYYLSHRYDQPSRQRKDSVVVDSIRMNQLLRFNADGSLDKTYRFDEAANQGLVGANGPINSMMHQDGKLLIYGAFTSFDGKPAGNIIRLNADGSIDQGFNAGTGADAKINSVTYNSQTDKYILTGQFKKFNNTAVDYLVMLNSDGTVDETFNPEKITGGMPTFAKQLNDGLVVVSGGFKSYAGINRQGFMILTPTAELAPGYNTVGNLIGGLSDIIETTSTDGKRALLLLGSFSAFDSQPVNNIVRVVLE